MRKTDPSGEPRPLWGVSTGSMGLKRSIQTAFVVVCCALALQARAGDAATPEAHLRWFVAQINEGVAEDAHDRLTAQFLERLDDGGLAQIATDLRETSGGFEIEAFRVESDELVSAVLAPREFGSRWRLTVRAGADDASLIDAIGVAPAPELGAPGVSTWEDLEERLTVLETDVSFGVYRVENLSDIGPVLEVGANDARAIGSAAHIFRLGALTDAVQTGEIDWLDRIQIRGDLIVVEEQRQGNSREGETWVLADLAQRMIATSDNVAADHVSDLVGRGAIEAYMERVTDHAALNQPFLLAGEAFKLKLATNQEIGFQYANADEQQRRAMLERELDGVKPNFQMLLNWRSPRMIESIGWFASARDMSRALVDLTSKASSPELRRVANILTSSSGLKLNSYRWPNAAYVGGAEPGVLSMNWMLIRRDGAMFALSLNVNDAEAALDHLTLTALAGSAINLLASE